MVHCTRAIVFTGIGLATSVALFWPLVATTRTGNAENALSPRDWLLGMQNKWSQAPRIGDHFTLGTVSGSLLAVLLDPCGRFDPTVEIHVWTRRYMLAVTMQSLLLVLARPVLILLGLHRPTRFRSHMSPIFVYASYSGILAYIVSQCILCQITVLRLRIVASPHHSNWAVRLFKVGLGLGGLLSVSAILWTIWFLREGLTKNIFHFVTLALSIPIIVTYLLFQGTAMHVFRRVACDAVVEAHHRLADVKARNTATRARAAAFFLAASATTSFLHFAALVPLFWRYSKETHWCYQLSVVLDIPFDAGLAIVCAGLVGPISDRAADLATVGHFAMIRRERLIHEKLVKAARATTGPALMLAALLQGEDPETLISKAVKRFRCISWDVLHANCEILLCGGTLDGQVASAELYAFSKPCLVGECDAFVSHSWHDNAQQKWEALTEWCIEFQRTNKRTPTMWIDKVCIDQKNLVEDLQCLPIFLASCNLLLIISGQTFTSRLWCCVELFVYIHMRMEDETLHLPMIITIGESESVRTLVNNSWLNFDVGACKCAFEEDKRRIVEVIENYPGGTLGFNNHVRRLGASLLQVLSENHHSEFAFSTSPSERTWKSLDDTLSRLSEPDDFVVMDASSPIVGNRVIGNQSDMSEECADLDLLVFSDILSI